MSQFIPVVVTDTSGDALEVATSNGDVTLESQERHPVTDWLFEPKDAEALANAILTAIGKTTVSAADIPLASSVSFNEAVLRVAAAHKRTVTFRYAKQNGGYIESRRLNPTEIVGDGAGLAALGTDPDRQATRRYRLDRIQGEVAFA